MKTIFLTFLFLLSFFITNVFSQNVVYANLDEIIKSSNVGSAIIDHYSKKNDKLIQDIKIKEKEIKEKEKLLISQKNILQPDEYTNKVNSLKKEINIFNNQSNEQLKNLNNEKENKTRNFMDQINIILKEFAEQNNIDIILNSNQILIGKSNIDVTDEILTIVNENIKKF